MPPRHPAPHEVDSSVPAPGAPPWIRTPEPMPPFTFPTAWPPGFNPDDRIRLAGAVVVDQADVDHADEEELHTHVTGQISLCLSGLVGIKLEDGIRAIPMNCAAWVPAGVRHTGVIGRNSSSIFFHVRGDVCREFGFPDKPVRLMLNAMTVEMIKHFARYEGECIPKSHAEHIAQVIVEELAIAQRLPIYFAPLPEHPVLKQLAYEIAGGAEEKSNAEWAETVAMSERTLTRLVRAQTGLSFKQWRLHLALMQSIMDLMKGESVESIAYKAGYETSSSFIEVFKRVFGETPGQYRKRL